MISVGRMIQKEKAGTLCFFLYILIKMVYVSPDKVWFKAKNTDKMMNKITIVIAINQKWHRNIQVV